jgi:hypothetical protein
MPDIPSEEERPDAYGPNESTNNNDGNETPSGAATFVNIEETIINSIEPQNEPKRKGHDWYDLTNLGVLCATFVSALAAAIFTGILAALTWNLAIDSSNSLIASTRAWVVPTRAYFDGEPKAGYNQRLKIVYENPGKEAATDVVHSSAWSPKTFPVTIDLKDMPYIDIHNAPWPPGRTFCDFDPSQITNRRTVYPSTQNEFITYGFPDPPYLPQGVIDGKEFFWITGCFTYRSPVTAQKLHHSPFCMYLQPKRFESIDKWTFEFCPSGSANAD